MIVKLSMTVRFVTLLLHSTVPVILLSKSSLNNKIVQEELNISRKKNLTNTKVLEMHRCKKKQWKERLEIYPMEDFKSKLRDKMI